MKTKTIILLGLMPLAFYSQKKFKEIKAEVANGQYEIAISDLHSFVKSEPKHVAGTYELALVYEKINKYDSAAIYYLKTKEIINLKFITLNLDYPEIETATANCSMFDKVACAKEYLDKQIDLSNYRYNSSPKTIQKKNTEEQKQVAIENTNVASQKIYTIKKADGKEQKFHWIKDTVIRTPIEFGKSIEVLIPSNYFYVVKQGQWIETSFDYWCETTDNRKHSISRNFDFFSVSLNIGYLLPTKRTVDTKTKQIILGVEDLNMNDNGSLFTSHEIYLIPGDKIQATTSKSTCPETNKIKTTGISIGIYEFIN